MLQIDVKSSRELQAILLAVRQADRAIQANIRKYTKQLIVPEWQKSVAEHADTRFEQRVLVSTARATVSNQNIRLSAATVGRPLSGGFNPKTSAHAAEFGANRAGKVTYQSTSRRGKSFSVTRRTKAQLRPRNKSGYVVMPAARQMIPRVASLWVQTTIRTFAEALEGKRG